MKEKEIKRSLFETSKKILEPVRYSFKNFTIYSIIEIWDWFQSIFIVVIMSYIIKYIDLKNLENLYFWIYIFIWTSIISLVWQLFSDSLYSNHIEEANNWLHKIYLTKFINLNNTDIEKYWVWKLSSIIFSWFEGNLNIIRLFLSIFVEVFSIIYIFVLISLKVPNIYYFLVFIVLFFFIIYFFSKWLNILKETRLKSKEYKIQLDRNRIKIFMSKFEILQNNKILNELSIIQDIFEKRKKLRFFWDLRKNSLNSISDLILKWIYIFIFFSVWIWVINWDFTMATFTLLIWLLQILTRYAWNIRWYMVDFFKNFIEVEKLGNYLKSVDNKKTSI